MDLDFDITPIGLLLELANIFSLQCFFTSLRSLPQRVFGRSDLDFVGFLEFYVLTQLCCFDSVLGLPALSSYILPYSIESQMDWSWDLTSPVGGSTLGAASQATLYTFTLRKAQPRTKKKTILGVLNHLVCHMLLVKLYQVFLLRSLMIWLDMCVLICICAMACFLHTINFYMFQVVINFDGQTYSNILPRSIHKIRIAPFSHQEWLQFGMWQQQSLREVVHEFLGPGWCALGANIGGLNRAAVYALIIEHSYWRLHIYSWFTYSRLWFSIAM